MRSIRLAGLVLVAVLVAGLAASSSASAVGLLFLLLGNPTFISNGNFLRVLYADSTDQIECATYRWTGELSSSTLAGNVVIRFLECDGKEGGGAECPAMSNGAPLANLITTDTLHGVIGLVLPKPAPNSDVGLELLPTSGKLWFTALGSCITTSSLTGSVAGLVEPVDVSSLTDKITFRTVTGIQKILDMDLTTGGYAEPKLAYGSTTATLESEDVYLFTTRVEVM